MLYIYFSFFFILSAQAITIDEINKRVLERSSQLQSEELLSKALSYEMKQTRRWQNPQIMSQIGTIRSGSQQGRTIELSVTQSIPLNSKYSLREEIAHQAIKNQESKTEYFKLWLTHQSLLAAWRFKIAHELYKHRDQRSKRYNLIKRYLETRPRVTAKQKIELSLIASQLKQLESEYDHKKAQLSTLENDLIFWIGEKIEVDHIQLTFPQIDMHETPQELKTLKNSEYELALGQLKQQKLNVELLNKERMPELYVGGGYRQENSDPVNHFNYLILGINIPLWDTGKDRLDASEVKLEIEKKKVESLEKSLRLKEQNQIIELNFYKKQLLRFPVSSINHFESIIKEAESAFRQGTIDAATFLQADNQAHENIDNVYYAQLDYLTSLSTFQITRNEKFNWTQAGNL